MRQIKGMGKTQGNSRKNFTNAKEGKGRIREQESAGQLNNKAKTQNNISLSKNRIKTEKWHNQRMAKQIQLVHCKRRRQFVEYCRTGIGRWCTL